jgi:hypothetical protein
VNIFRIQISVLILQIVTDFSIGIFRNSHHIFTFGETIDPQLHFHVPFEQLAWKSLVEMINSRRFSLIQAPFWFGKTSHLVALERALKTQSHPVIV